MIQLDQMTKQPTSGKAYIEGASLSAGTDDELTGGGVTRYLGPISPLTPVFQ
jgi:hypothetical protein